MLIIIANHRKYDCLRLCTKIAEVLTQLDVPHHFIKTFPFKRHESQLIRNAKSWIILGGDGTVLSTFAHFRSPVEGYILAVNFGTVGYMAGIHETKALSLIEKFITAHPHLQAQPSAQPVIAHKSLHSNAQRFFKKENRFTLETELLTDTKTSNTNLITASYQSLNETTLRVANSIQPITIEVSINRAKIFKVLGDGAIIATPTGSTAYNLSAGGPILSPEIEAFVLSFIAPHSLTAKPIVVARGDVVELTVYNKAVLAIDGTIKKTLSPYHRIRCRLSAAPLTFVTAPTDTAYKRLKHKLHWGE